MELEIERGNQCVLDRVERSDAEIGMDNEAVRNAWVRSALRALPSGWRLLDAGAGTQPYRDACGHLTYVSQDFAAYDGQGDRTGLQTTQFDYGKLDFVCDITAIPQPDASFDAVLCTEVLEHVPAPLPALCELSRLLRPGGELILTAPFVSLTHFAPYHFCTGFSRFFFEKHLDSLGFEIVELRSNGGYYDLMAQEILRLGSVAQTYSGGGIGLMERLAVRVLMRALRRMRRRDRASWELACLGLHVRARRKESKR